MYGWIVLLHIVGAFIFVISHGVSAWMSVQIVRERDRARIAALLDLSSASLAGVYIGLLLLLVGGIWAALYANHFSRVWPWAALVLLVVIIIAMYAIATPYFRRLREAVGATEGGSRTIAVAVGTDEEVEKLASQAPVLPLMTVGVVGLLLILWLMVVKPF